MELAKMSICAADQNATRRNLPQRLDGTLSFGRAGSACAGQAPRRELIGFVLLAFPLTGQVGLFLGLQFLERFRDGLLADLGSFLVDFVLSMSNVLQIERGLSFVLPLRQLLKEIAQSTGGEYYRATDRESLKEGLQKVLDSLERSKLMEGGAMASYREDFHPFLLWAFAVLALELLLRYTLLRVFP